MDYGIIIDDICYVDGLTIFIIKSIHKKISYVLLIIIFKKSKPKICDGSLIIRL